MPSASPQVSPAGHSTGSCPEPTTSRTEPEDEQYPETVAEKPPEPSPEIKADKKGNSSNEGWGERWLLQRRLVNTGSVARDHLACERTFLAYVRTSMGISMTGVALVQLFSISPPQYPSSSSSPVLKASTLGKPLGATIILVGFAVMALGTWRFFQIETALIHGNFPTAKLPTILVSVAVVLLIAIIFGTIVGTLR